MRKRKDGKEIPESLTNYIWNYFRDTNPDKDQLNTLAIFLADQTYHYAAYTSLTDDYTRLYIASVFTYLWDTLQSRGIDMFYILDNELRNDRFMLTMQLFALSGVAVVTPYMVKGIYQKYMTLEEQAEWALSFNEEDCDPKTQTMTIDGNGEYSRYAEVADLIEKYMKQLRNIVYIEKDASVNFLDQVKQIAKESKYLSVFRNHAPDIPKITVISK